MPVLLGPVDQASVMPGTMLMCRLLHGCAGNMRLAPVESLVATPVFHGHRLGERQSQRRGGRSSGHALGRTRRPDRRLHLRAVARRAWRGPSKAKERSLPVTVRRAIWPGGRPTGASPRTPMRRARCRPAERCRRGNAGLTYGSISTRSTGPNVSVRIMLSSWEPPTGIESMTYALREACSPASRA